MNSRPPIGVMEGRLSPPSGGRIQSFPRETWRDEFVAAGKIGLDLIELVFDFEDYPNHPLMTDSGLEEIRRLQSDTGVQVRSVCADFFMSLPLHRGPCRDRDLSYAVLTRLAANCHKLGITDIVLPCVDQSSLKTREEESTLIEYLREIHPLLNSSEVSVAVESDLDPFRFRHFLKSAELKKITVNYDTGNSAALGYRPAEELASYGDSISSVHIKDRRLHGATVPLGTGDTDFDGFFTALKKTGYRGAFIIQAARDGDEMEAVTHQLEFVRNLLQKHSWT